MPVQLKTEKQKSQGCPGECAGVAMSVQQQRRLEGRWGELGRGAQLGDPGQVRRHCRVTMAAERQDGQEPCHSTGEGMSSEQQAPGNRGRVGHGAGSAQAGFEVREDSVVAYEPRCAASHSSSGVPAWNRGVTPGAGQHQ